MQYTPSHLIWKSVLLPCVPAFPKWPLLFRFSVWEFEDILSPVRKCYMDSPFHSYYICQPNDKPPHNVTEFGPQRNIGLLKNNYKVNIKIVTLRYNFLWNLKLCTAHCNSFHFAMFLLLKHWLATGWGISPVGPDICPSRLQEQYWVQSFEAT